jgi:tetratricopeptide (TPR) repeat protein
VLFANAATASAKTEDAVSQYANARLAEIGNSDDVAVKTYLKLYREAPDSEILADRLFESAVRSGDMPTAVRAARAMELRNGGSAETALLLFADAFRARNWTMADQTAQDVSQGGNFAFMAPMLKSWIRVAQGKPADLPESDGAADAFFAYYSNDQRIYMQLASREFAAAKFGLRAMASQQGDYVRDLLLTSADVIAANGDKPFAEALLRTVWGGEDPSVTQPTVARLSASEGLSALYRRIGTSLVEQNVPEQGLLLTRVADWIAPQSDATRIALARALEENGLPERAMAQFAAIAPDSSYAIPAVEGRIDLLTKQGRQAEALAVAKEAGRQAPNSVAMKLLQARAQEAVGDLPATIAIYRYLAAAAESNNVSPRQQGSFRLLLASALDQSGDWPGARAELEKALVVEPNNAQVLNYLGYTLLERGEDRERATEMVMRAHSLNPTSSAITDSLGWAFFLRGDVKRALPLLEQAAKAAGNDAAINEHLGDAYWALGRRRDARYAWNVARQAAEGEALARLASKIDAGVPSR